MDGREMVKVIDEELSRRGMTQYEFCHAIGVQSSAMSAWRKGSTPKKERIEQIERFLDINFADYEKPEADEETMQLREMLRNRQDLRVLLHSAKDVPPSSIYALISQIEKMKEDST